jgi:hypothetical protein
MGKGRTQPMVLVYIVDIGKEGRGNVRNVTNRLLGTSRRFDNTWFFSTTSTVRGRGTPGCSPTTSRLNVFGV